MTVYSRTSLKNARPSSSPSRYRSRYASGSSSPLCLASSSSRNGAPWSFPAWASSQVSPYRNRYCTAGSLATMKSMNSLAPASRAPGVPSLGMISSASRSTVAYSGAEKNRGA